MTEIYDEIGYIKEVLEKGLSERWQRDARLLARFYKIEGKDKKEIKQLISKKCQNIKGFNIDIQFEEINNLIESAWKDEKPLRAIKQVEISKESLQWFLDLEQKEISDEEYNFVKERREKYKIEIKKNIYNFERIKMLFTFYIWYLIQKNYCEDRTAIMFPLSRNQKRIRQDSFLKSNFKVMPEINLMFDLKMVNITRGYIDKNNEIHKRIMIANFIKDNDILNTPISDENRIIISGQDLYDCGHWLQKQRYGSFICKRCGKEFAHSNQTKQEQNRFYCKECSDIIRRHKFDGDKKVIICQDCGIEVEIDKNDVKTCRCDKCQEKIEKKLKSERNRRYYENKKQD